MGLKKSERSVYLPMALCVLGFACAPSASGPTSQPCEVEEAHASGGEEGDSAQEQEEERNITFNLERAALPDVARILGTVTQLAVVIDAEVDPVAECLTISLLNPGPISVEEAIRMTAAAYAPAGLELRRTSTQLTFSRSEGTTFPACPSDAETPSRPEPSAPVRPSPTRVTVEREAQLGEAVRSGVRGGPTEYLVTRATRDMLFTQATTVFQRTRVIPHQENGRVVSIKVYGIRRNSPMGVLGFQNGDGLQRVNGMEIANPRAALDAYVAARSASELRVELVRRGQALTLRYRVVESLPTP